MHRIFVPQTLHVYFDKGPQQTSCKRGARVPKFSMDGPGISISHGDDGFLNELGFW